MGFHVCYNSLKAMEEKDGGQMIIGMENRMCAHGLEQRESSSFRNSAWLCMSYVLSRKAAQPGMRRWARGGQNRTCAHGLEEVG